MSWNLWDLMDRWNNEGLKYNHQENGYGITHLYLYLRAPYEERDSNTHIHIFYNERRRV